MGALVTSGLWAVPMPIIGAARRSSGAEAQGGLQVSW